MRVIDALPISTHIEYNHLPHRKTFEPHAAIHIEISMHIARYKLIVELEIKYLQQSGENTQLD